MKSKIYIINILYYLGIIHAFFFLNLFFGKLLCINYHCTPELNNENFEKQIRFLSKYFNQCDHEKLLKSTNNYNLFLFKKPFLILTFDDGLRSNFENAVPILEKYNMKGWFFVCPSFIQKSELDSINKNFIFPKQKFLDNRYCMNVFELNLLKNKHIIGSHTFNHHRFTESDNMETLNFEIHDSKIKLSSILNKEVDTFAWVGGEEKHYTKSACSIIEDNYKIVFNTLVNMIFFKINPKAIPRTNIESDFSKQLFLFQISGLLDLYYLPKRFKIFIKLKLLS
jgi:hypothetical protein